MMNGKLDSLRFYDWSKTIKDEKNQGNKGLHTFPSSFHLEMKEPFMNVKIEGKWGDWELTDEGTGKYPIIKCYIKDGTFEIDISNKKTTYDLQNNWIKICVKIKNTSEGMYVISEKEDTLYSTNYSFPFDKKNRSISTLLERLMVTWFKEHRDLLSNHINAYKIYYRTSNDLTLAGWDTNYVTSFNNVNKTIQEKGLYPKKFNNEFVDESLGFPLEFKMDGTFDAWQITTGADGQNLNFICKIGEDSSFTNGTTNQQYKASPNAFLKIQVKLEYFNSERSINDPTGLGDGHQKNLGVKSDYDENENSPVILISSFYSEEILGTLEIFINAMFKDWLTRNINEFEHIFSYFLLQETAQHENFQWIKPTTAYYGVASVEDENENPSLEKSVFSTMTMVENRKNESPQHTVDARLLQAVNNESAFGIDMPLFVEKWLEAGLVAMHIGTLDQFEKTENGLFIKNKEKIKFGTITNHSNEDVPAYIDPDKFRLGITNNQIVLELENLYWEQARGITGHINYKQSFDISLKSGTDSLGKEYKNVLVPTEPVDPTLLLTYTLEDWKQTEDLIVEITTGVVIGIIVGFIPFGAVFSKLKNVIRRAFKTSGNSASAEIGNVVSLELREVIRQEMGETTQEFTSFIESVSRRSSNETTLFQPGMTQAEISQAINQVANMPDSVFGKIWGNKFKIIGGIAVGAVAGMIPTAIIKVIENVMQENYSEFPTIDEFMANCVGAIQWPEDSEFQIETAQLQGIFLMGGKLNKDI